MSIKPSSHLDPRIGAGVLAFAFLALGLLMPTASSAEPFKEANVNRWGADYRQFTLASGGADACAQVCAGDAQCRSWTYVKAGVVGPNPMCRLKSAVPHGKADPCCISGIAAGASAGVLAGYPSADRGTSLAQARQAPSGITAAIRQRPAKPSASASSEAIRLDMSPLSGSAPTATGAPISLTPPAWAQPEK